MPLPEIRKRIIYLDQFFFSNAFKKCDERFVDIAKQISRASSLQILVAPFSSIHEDETHQWRGYEGRNKDDLMTFIKDTSRGHKFELNSQVVETQIVRSFENFLSSEPKPLCIEEIDAFSDNIHQWDDYFRIDVGRYIGDIELIRSLKVQSVEGLVDTFPDWRQSTNSFDQDVELELQSAEKNYLDSYVQYVRRVATGDFSAVIDSPIISTVIESLLDCLPDNSDPEDRLKKIAAFFRSPHFAEVPYHKLSARMYASLKDMVRKGAYQNREKSIRRLTGFFHDVSHIATYAPYCDAFVMDQPMASIVGDRRVGLETTYNVKVFSLNNWSELSSWLTKLEQNISPEHCAGLTLAYPRRPAR